MGVMIWYVYGAHSYRAYNNNGRLLCRNTAVMPPPPPPPPARPHGTQQNVKRQTAWHVGGGGGVCAGGGRRRGGRDGGSRWDAPPSRDIGVIIWRTGRLSLSRQLTLNRIITPRAPARRR